MARPESVALGGFFPTPPDMVPLIAGLFRKPQLSEGEKVNSWDCRTVVFLDPCAGRGEAVTELASLTLGGFREARHGGVAAELYAVELEQSRSKKVQDTWCQKDGNYSSCHTLHGDAFEVVWKVGRQRGASVLYLNPPYDQDKAVGRLEERFLQRFTGALAVGGALVYVVPIETLAASADTLARCYSDVKAFRFPAEHYAAYRQVVLVAIRQHDLMESDPGLVQTLRAWAANPASLPELAEGVDPCLDLLTMEQGEHGFGTWEVATFDLTSLLQAARPWCFTSRSGALTAVPNTLTDPAEDPLRRTYHLATPPRPAHIAAGVAAGVFNGVQVGPDNPESGLPPVLVKGVFTREFKTIETKHNKDGEAVAQVQVQQPKLSVTVLDLEKYEYTTVRASGDVTGATDVKSMTTADLLDEYGEGLVSTMLTQCPVLHDPRRDGADVELAPVARPLYPAQADAARACVKLLGGLNARRIDRLGKAAFLLGEIGSGKTSVSLSVASTIGARRTLVLCPPHLLDGWTDQIRIVLPSWQVRVLSCVTDVEEFAADGRPEPMVALLTRETAKLGHALGAVRGSCPKCGGPLPEKDLAKTRARCERRQLREGDVLARCARALARALMPAFPGAHEVKQLMWEPGLVRAAERRVKAGEAATSGHIPTGVYSVLAAKGELDSLELLLLASSDAQIELSARAVYVASLKDQDEYGQGHFDRDRVASWCLMLPEGRGEELAAELETLRPAYKGYYGGGNRQTYPEKLAEARAGKWTGWTLTLKEGTVQRDGVARGPEAALAALRTLTAASKWVREPECGEPLYQSLPEPRRVPLAKYVAKRHPNLFDLLILDEAHELAKDGSAQERAAHRLTALGLPTLLLTGSLMNGYANSMFTNLWALSPAFRTEFDRDQCSGFVDRYGYKKRVVDYRDEDGAVVAFGSVTDRVEKRERAAGDAPGVLPLLLLRHLLPLAVTLQKADLGADVPPSTEEVPEVYCPEPLLGNYKRLRDALIRQLRKDKTDPEKAGRLLGALADLPSYLDLCTDDTGNQDDGSYEARYPESCGGGLVARAEPLPRATVTTKERLVCDLVRAELAAGRRCMVFTWHTRLMPRLARILKAETGASVATMDPGKVGTAKRQAWIDSNVVAKGAQVLVTNPVCVQTGLNNLVYFATVVWVQNPACNPHVKRQADGRVDRVGQTMDTRIVFPVYQNTAQVTLHKLLMHKVAVSRGVDGLDAEAALVAAGVGDAGEFSAFSVGRQLYSMMERGESD